MTVHFAYVSLWEGFLIVRLTDAGAPTWAIVLVALAALVGGGTIFHRYQRAVAEASAARRAPEEPVGAERRDRRSA